MEVHPVEAAERMLGVPANFSPSRQPRDEHRAGSLPSGEGGNQRTVETNMIHSLPTRLIRMAAAAVLLAVGYSSPGPPACTPDVGIDAVWNTDDGAIAGGGIDIGHGYRRVEASHRSVDGGRSWAPASVTRGPYNSARQQRVETPR